MSKDFPSVEGLTWQGQRSSTSPMESTDNLANGSSLGQKSAEESSRELSNLGHTKGPWLIHQRHRWVVPAEDASKEPSDALPICQLRDPDERLTEDETLANGFLIAAAPELYEALEGLADCGEEAWGAKRPCVESAFNALKKARGET